MTATELHDALRRRGITLRVVRGDLRARPAKLLTDDDRTALRAYRHELIDRLAVHDVTPIALAGHLVLVKHQHECPGCRRRFKCTAPSCSTELTTKRCVVCVAQGRTWRAR